MLVFKYGNKKTIDIIDKNNNEIGYFHFNERVGSWSVNIDMPLYQDTARGLFNDIVDKLDEIDSKVGE